MLEYLRHEQASKCAMPAKAAVQRCTTFCGSLCAVLSMPGAVPNLRKLVCACTKN